MNLMMEVLLGSDKKIIEAYNNSQKSEYMNDERIVISFDNYNLTFIDYGSESGQQQHSVYLQCHTPYHHTIYQVIEWKDQEKTIFYYGKDLTLYVTQGNNTPTIEINNKLTSVQCYDENGRKLKYKNVSDLKRLYRSLDKKWYSEILSK